MATQCSPLDLVFQCQIANVGVVLSRKTDGHRLLQLLSRVFLARVSWQQLSHLQVAGVHQETICLRVLWSERLSCTVTSFPLRLFVSNVMRMFQRRSMRRPQLLLHSRMWLAVRSYAGIRRNVFMAVALFLPPPTLARTSSVPLRSLVPVVFSWHAERHPARSFEWLTFTVLSTRPISPWTQLPLAALSNPFHLAIALQQSTFGLSVAEAGAARLTFSGGATRPVLQFPQWVHQLWQVHSHRRTQRPLRKTDSLWRVTLP